MLESRIKHIVHLKVNKSAGNVLQLEGIYCEKGKMLMLKIINVCLCEICDETLQYTFCVWIWSLPCFNLCLTALLAYPCNVKSINIKVPMGGTHYILYTGDVPLSMGIFYTILSGKGIFYLTNIWEGVCIP